MFRWRLVAAIACVALVTSLSACSGGSSVREHYVSSEIQGEKEKINLEEVQKAFFETKGKDFNSQMAAFEKRVNEIYDGEGVVALDATREDKKLKVVGFISKSDKPGLQPGDEKLFTIEQTGDVVNNDLPYRVSGYNDRPYYEGHRSVLDSPFVQMMVLSHMMGGFGGRYYTPYSSYGGLMGYRNTWRQSPQYTQQKAANTGFFSRFGKKSDGSLRSNTAFGGGNFSGGSSTPRRSWGGLGGGSSSTTTSTSSSGWGGRRSTSIFGGGGSRRMGGWGGRRGR